MKKMKNRLKISVIALFSLGISITSQAQTDTLYLSLDKAIEIGINQRIDIQSAHVDFDIAVNNKNRTNLNWLPEINTSANARYNTQLATTVLPEGFGGENLEEIQFGTRNNTFIAIDFDQPLIQPSQSTKIKIDRKEMENNRLALDQIQNDAKYEIVESYYETLMKQELYFLTLDYRDKSETLYELMKAKYNMENILENELLKQKLEFQNADMKAKKALNDKDLAMSTFKNHINLETEHPIVLFETFDIEEIAMMTTKSRNYALEKLNITNEITALNLKRIGRERIPTLNLYGNYTYQFQANTFNYTHPNWNPFNYVGLKLNIPITQSLKFKNQRRGYSYELDKNKLNYQQQVSHDELEWSRVHLELSNLKIELEYATNNLQLAKKIYELDEVQYNLGRLLYTDLVNSAKSYNEAKTNDTQASFNYYKALLTYNKLNYLKAD